MIRKTTKASFPEMRTAFGARLKALLKALDLEQKTLAASGGVSAPTISAYLAGQSQPAADVIAKWVRDFKVNANWLLTGEGEMFIGAHDKPRASIPPEEFSPTLSFLQREMLTYKRLQAELGMLNDRIAEGLEIMIKRNHSDEARRTKGAATDQEMGNS